MGGAVGFVLREPDGTVNKMRFNGGYAQAHVVNIRAITGDREHWQQAKDEWADLSDPWFGKKEQAAPYHHGLVVLDYCAERLDTLLTNYGMGSIQAAAVANCRSGVSNGDVDERFHELVKNGRLYHLDENWERASQVRYDEITQALDGRELQGFDVEYEPLNFQRRDRREEEDVRALFQSVAERFGLTDEEIEQWNDWTENWCEERFFEQKEDSGPSEAETGDHYRPLEEATAKAMEWLDNEQFDRLNRALQKVPGLGVHLLRHLIREGNHEAMETVLGLDAQPYRDYPVHDLVREATLDQGEGYHNEFNELLFKYDIPLDIGNTEQLADELDAPLSPGALVHMTGNDPWVIEDQLNKVARYLDQAPEQLVDGFIEKLNELDKEPTTYFVRQLIAEKHPCAPEALDLLEGEQAQPTIGENSSHMSRLANSVLHVIFNPADYPTDLIRATGAYLDRWLDEPLPDHYIENAHLDELEPGSTKAEVLREHVSVLTDDQRKQLRADSQES